MTKRRAFLLSLGGLAGVSAVGGLGYLGIQHNRDKGRMMKTAAGELVHFLGSWDLGDGYLEAFPDEADPDVLLTSLLEGLADPDDPEKVQEHVCQKIKDDFSQARTREVHGWILSVTECRLYALVAQS